MRRGWLARCLIICAAVSLLAGCGYQLKGQFRLADGLSPMVWQSQTDADELYQTLRGTFSLYGLVLQTGPADTLLQLHRESYAQVSLDETLILTLEIEWSLVNQFNQRVISRRVTRAESRLPDDDDDTRLERRQALRNRVVLRVLDQLEAISNEDLADTGNAPS
jgi:outer membrane lipopolysaccharide assembly protein LptE/RlpB